MRCREAWSGSPEPFADRHLGKWGAGWGSGLEWSAEVRPSNLIRLVFVLVEVFVVEVAVVVGV
jgi:hypothetical protein